MDESVDLSGISVKNTPQGFVIELKGQTYKQIGEKINKGTAIKPFYSELKKFIKAISDL